MSRRNLSALMFMISGKCSAILTKLFIIFSIETFISTVFWMGDGICRIFYNGDWSGKGIDLK